MFIINAPIFRQTPNSIIAIFVFNAPPRLLLYILGKNIRLFKF